jgi:sigma-54 specific flagellar transcriptional regulator A
MGVKKITEIEIEFLKLANELAMANPFDPARTTLMQEFDRIAGKGSSSLSDETLNHLNQILKNLSKWSSSDIGIRADQFEIARMFLVYYRFRKDFEKFIRLQQDQPSRIIKLNFADQIQDELAAQGFSDTTADRLIAVFFQLRRAYLFISELLTGNSSAMHQLRCRLWNNLFTSRPDLYLKGHWQNLEDFSTLILGETGSGKGNVARALGRSNFIEYDRKQQSFRENFCNVMTEINLAEYPASLIESELFGHRKGAFTGAIDHYEGVFSRTSPSGALFIDEIGEIDEPTQVKLLRVLQNRSFQPVGSRETKNFRGRIIAATNRKITDLSNGKRFRQDFFYRLCTDIIEVPNLRARTADDPAEMRQLITAIAQKMFAQMPPDVLMTTVKDIESHLPSDYSWPGNVRELEQAIRSYVIHQSYAPVNTTTGNHSAPNAALAASGLTAHDLVVKYCLELYAVHGNYEKVASITQLDRRTVSKYVAEARNTDLPKTA